MIYREFSIGRFRGVEDVNVSLVKGDLVLLLGLNESGKTTILKGIEAFDHRNDPSGQYFDRFLTSVRNKAKPYSNEPAVVTAEIELEGELKTREFRDLSKKWPKEEGEVLEDFLRTLNDAGSVTLSRVFPFRSGDPEIPFYRFEVDHAFTAGRERASQVGARLIELCPFILYFEDFTDRIPERIFVVANNDAFNPDWYDIIDGLFYNTDPNFSEKAFRQLFSRSNRRPDDAKTVMKRVNKTLNKVFTRKWAELSGVEDIHETELIERFGGRSRYFEIKITDADGTTFSVDERSKGALWYLSFLMKTEFRRKKMRKDSGKPIFLIDEPASNLHSTAQQNMLGDFRKLVEDTSVIYTTHSQYLVSLENTKNTYVIRRSGGVVTATPWSQLLREEPSTVSHYQPLADLLQLTPNTLDVPWTKAVITEGPSDRFVLLVMYRALEGSDPQFVVYPGTNAHNLGELISLNIGWQADFRVLLDGDETGLAARKKYEEAFELPKGTVHVLPKANNKIEKMFTQKDREFLYSLAFGKASEGKVTKGEFQGSVAALAQASTDLSSLRAGIGKATQDRFTKLFGELWEPQGNDG
jgi:ABC-type multidrug transport system ATPase subunit